MDITEERFFRMSGEPKDIESLSRAVADLRHTLFSAIHDIAVLKEILREHKLLDQNLYKRLRIAEMLQDHGGGGAHPWERCSGYAYTLDEEDFLRKKLGATQQDIEEYREDVRGREIMT